MATTEPEISYTYGNGFVVVAHDGSARIHDNNTKVDILLKPDEVKRVWPILCASQSFPQH